uniref:Uncharacterized protein n=1 Tax=Physcomitrium patens TaxID=3218 RepID=A0A2K1K3D2_PHYPA|nr:hypothetical protein PHYPA_012752 [Physcomitrium patens]
MPRCFVMKRFVIVRQFLYDKLDSGGAIFSERRKRCFIFLQVTPWIFCEVLERDREHRRAIFDQILANCLNEA